MENLTIFPSKIYYVFVWGNKEVIEIANKAIPIILQLYIIRYLSNTDIYLFS